MVGAERAVRGRGEETRRHSVGCTAFELPIVMFCFQAGVIALASANMRMFQLREDLSLQVVGRQ